MMDSGVDGGRPQPQDGESRVNQGGVNNGAAARHADYACPNCGGRLHQTTVPQKFRCGSCDETVSEAISTQEGWVQRFFDSACSSEVSL